MSDNLTIGLVCVIAGAAIGLPLALLLPKYSPKWCRQVWNKPWRKFYPLGLILCAAMSFGHFVQGRPILGGLFAGFSGLAMAVLVIWMFRPPTPERQRGQPINS